MCFTDWPALDTSHSFMVHVYFAVRPEKLDITKSMIFGSMSREFYLKHYDPRRWIIEVPPSGTARTDEKA
jgi:hypothetical protein